MSDADQPERSMTAAHSICPFCGVGCGIEYAGNERARGWKGPVNTKGEICPKGAAAWEMVEDEERLQTPLVRDGETLVAASWTDALDQCERELSRIVDEHGPDALAFFASSNCTNEENYLLAKLARWLGTNNVDNCARLCHSSTVAAMGDRLGAGAMTNSLDDLRDADCYLVVGANPAAQHPVIFRSYLLPAIRDGTTLIHVDPQANDTTEAADIHLPVRPGHDIPLLNAMAAVLVDEGKLDDAFVAERTTGIEALRTHLETVDVDANAELAGVDPSDLRAAARAYADADSAAIFTGMGMSQHHYGTENVHALINLALLTGNVGRPGTGVNPLRGQNNVQGAGDVGALPSVLPGYESVTDEAARERVAEVWGFEPPEKPGLTEVELTHRFGESVKGAVVFGENPLVTEPNANATKAAFERLDFCLVIDLFEVETAAVADVVLPGSAWAEKEGTVTNTDRRVMRMRAGTTPPGEARRDLSILASLGRRLAPPNLFDFESAEAVFDELTAVNPLYAGMSYDGIGDGYQRWPFDEGDGRGTDVLHTERFATGERTAPLRPVDHVPPADEVGENQVVLTTGRVLQQFNSGAVSRRSGVLTRMRAEDVLQIHPDDAARFDVDDGEQVRVWNDRGEVFVDAEVTPAIRPGTVFCTFHYAEPLANRLTGDELDPVAKIPEYKHSAVWVEPSG